MSEDVHSPLLKEEIINPQTTLLLESIESRLPVEEVGVLTKSGRINKNGREIAENIYQEFLLKSNGDYKQILDICREAESVLDTNDPDYRDNETVKIIQSLRGKVVYNAHRIWVEKQMDFEDRMIDTSASKVMHYAKVLKKEAQLDIYEEATNIERERAEILAQLQIENIKIEKENTEIIEADIKESDITPTERINILGKTKQKLREFARTTLNPSLRRKIVAGTLSTLAAASILLSHITNLGENRSTNEIIIQEFNKPQSALVEKTTVQHDFADFVIEIDNEYLESIDEIPDIDYETKNVEGFESEEKEQTTPQTADDITSKNSSAKTDDTQAEKQTKDGSDNTIKSRHGNINNEIIEIVLKQSEYKGTLKYENNYIPKNLVNLAENGIVTLGTEVKVAKESLDSILGFINEADSLGYNIGVAYGYRSYETQQKIYENNPAGAAKAGHSQHQSGFAVDLYLLEYGARDWSTMSAFPRELIPAAEKWGLIRPLAWDTPHFVALNAISPDLITMLKERGLEINPTDPSYLETNYILNEILMALSNKPESFTMNSQNLGTPSLTN